MYYCVSYLYKYIHKNIIILYLCQAPVYTEYVSEALYSLKLAHPVVSTKSTLAVRTCVDNVFAARHHTWNPATQPSTRRKHIHFKLSFFTQWFNKPNIYQRRKNPLRNIAPTMSQVMVPISREVLVVTCAWQWGQVIDTGSGPYPPPLVYTTVVDTGCKQNI